MRAHVLKYGTYFYDDSIDEESDNVQWIAGLDMPLFLKSPYWKIISAVSCMLFCMLMALLKTYCIFFNSGFFLNNLEVLVVSGNGITSIVFLLVQTELFC